MDALIAKADATQPLSKKRKRTHPSDSKPGPSQKSDKTSASITKNTSLPTSLRSRTDKSADAPQYKHIANPKLRRSLVKTSTHIAQSQALLSDAIDLLPSEETGFVQAEDTMERTWRLSQVDIVKEAGGEAARGRLEMKLDGGPYRVRYTKNGRHMAIAGRTGHVASFDTLTGAVHSELQLGETCSDVVFLQDHSFYAVAQQKYVFIYDRDGVEIHKLKAHVSPTRLEFLPYHWLLASVGTAGYLKYQDTSTGQLVAEHRTALGACSVLAQNPHNAVLYLGHQNGCVTLWTPNLPHPAVKVLAHLGPLSSVSIDPSESGRYMATTGKDGSVKVWDCRNWKGAVREWTLRSGGKGDAEVEWSQKGVLAVGSGGSVNMYTSPSIKTPHHSSYQPPLYLTHPLLSASHRPITSLRFAPLQDILTIGHAKGTSSILVPGAGEGGMDTGEGLDLYEGVKGRREREVRGLLDKIQPDMITLDPEIVGSLAPPSKLTIHTNGGTGSSRAAEIPFARLPRAERLRVSGKADLTEEFHSDAESADGSDDTRKKVDNEAQEKRKMRGKGKSLKRYLRKQRKNVIDPAAVAIRSKIEKQKAERKAEIQGLKGIGMGANAVHTVAGKSPKVLHTDLAMEIAKVVDTWSLAPIGGLSDPAICQNVNRSGGGKITLLRGILPNWKQ
ncbi:BING4CT-domain-containing protein [Lentinula edodes]|uniref:U three protein 7 n=1 Tax=Lentinula edodes TaxID=5353 RepID=A0A1Q3ECM0_LENED|nr:BING4CT-domain-containing protein [Lentinula edodes]